MSDSNSNQAQKANLARIRDNQRRSRARRKEYLQELETKYRTCEAVGVEASSEIQTAARRVLEENKRLRQLLKQQGLSDAEIDGSSPSAPSSPTGTKSDYSETPLYPTAATTLDQLLVTRKECKPGSACGSEDGPRRQSCAPSVMSHASQQSPTPNFQPPRPSQPQLQPQLQPRLQPQPQAQRQYQPANTGVAPQPSPHARSMSNMSTPSNHDHYQSLPTEYPVYDPQAHSAYMYPLPLDHMANMANMTQWSLPTTQQTIGTQSQAFMPNTVTTIAYTGDTNSSSCYVAADAIRSFNANAGPEVEQALGCRDGSECHVNNTVVFDLMDRYAASGNEGPS